MLSPSAYRKFIHPLVGNKLTYPFGMALVRLSRKKRKKVASTYLGGPELETISNFAGNIKMCVDKHSYMGGSIYWSGYHHLNEFLFLRDVLKDDMIMLDIGANQGEFSLFAAQKLTKGKIYAFEPVNSNLESLRTNIKLNGFNNIEVVAKGLFNKYEKLPVYTSYDSALNGGRHEGLSTIYPDDYRATFEQEIELIPFDENYFEKLSRLDVVKIDVEGSELPVFQGMIKTLKAFHPIILMELNVETARNAGYEVDDLVEFLTKLNYKSYKIFRGKLIEKSWSNDMKWDNFVFVYDVID